MEISYDNADCISKYNLLQEICGFHDGPLVEEGNSVSDTCIRLSVMGKATGLIVNTDTPYSKVTFKVNGIVHSEVTSNDSGNATLDCMVNFDSIHCPQIVSDATLLNFSLKR